MEYKFKGKCIQDGNWVIGSLHVGQSYWISQKSQPLCPKQVIPETVGMYTGTTDKNGTEIYGGNTIQAYIHGDTEKPPHIHTVSFRNGCFWFGNWNWVEFLDKFREVTVVGTL